MNARIFPLKFIIILLVLLALTGCGGGEAAPSDEAYYDDIPMDAPAEAGSAGNQASPGIQQRIVIMTGSMAVETEEPARLVDFITDLAIRYSGYVTDTNLTQQTWGEKTYIEGSITIRVPSEKLYDAINAIESQEITLLSKDISGEDVTAEYVDLKSRLRNLEAAAEQLQEIMDNSTNTEAVLKVYQELVKVTEEAEVVRGQINYYEEAAAMSSLTVTIDPIVVIEEEEEKRWQFGETFKDAFERLSFSVESWLERVVRFFVYGLPSFILWAGPWLVAFFFIGRWIYRRFIRKTGKPDKGEAEK